MRQPLYLKSAAVAVLLLIVILIPISAWLRHAEIPPAAVLATAPDNYGVLMRGAHRLIASTLLALVLVINVPAWLGGGTYRYLRRPATVLLAITLALALLGISAGSSRHIAGVLGHLFGGLFAAITAVWLVLAAVAPNGGIKPPLPALAAVAWTVVITLVLGGLAGPAGWALAMALHITGAMLLAGLLGYALIRSSGRGWSALLLLAAAGVSGWWAGRAGGDALAATTHTAAIMLLLLELVRLLFQSRSARSGFGRFKEN